MNKFSLSILALSLVNIAHASDARNYTLFPINTNITELRLADSTTTTGNATLHNDLWTLKHIHYIDVLGNLGAIQLTLPVANTRLSANSNKYNSSGFGDVTVLFGLGLYNTPALTSSEIKLRNHDGLSIASSISLTIPTGDYDNTKLLNVGTNRSSQKLELNTTYRYKNIMFEANVYGINYSNNNEYRGYNKLEQKPLYGLETHTSLNISPQAWISFDTFNIDGARNYVNNTDLNNKQRSFSAGITAGYLITKNQMLKIIYQNTSTKDKNSSALEGTALSYNYMW